ncbi:MAG: hypothetical protein CO183_01115 [Candidatus Zambryskibacteria bacterium CG_4_9_14_3_um_filter_42_9]|uniref:Nudix hydrolase domain-containing protein n=1 Tax=Candidatus Zambryskibacteria bacterium CG22_combo_CG10-13_8_21_14_all_42_17 TaxID=1975118 RepID=A0A2H0BE98_9BACT|nr:MAG: hypothetical protein COX06_00610 [Candidatus Zambryskibacteria bacterium CG22_combo_CG10-13_8_21_14_all_42_17]PJA36850.1 MAG: hypothetical protein CO183_01115 [Candidatus Zambryskibacteria bacterium CG_4_9_14_3_um_filter_42_9]
MKTHYVCVVIHRCNPETRELEFIVIDNRLVGRETGRPSRLYTKFPGGTNRDYPGESVPLTRDREALEETHLVFSQSKQIWKAAGRAHIKYGFLVDWTGCWGTLRQKPIVDGGDELSPPRWVNARTLGRELSYTHQDVYLVACRRYFGIF